MNCTTSKVCKVAETMANHRLRRNQLKVKKPEMMMGWRSDSSACPLAVCAQGLGGIQDNHAVFQVSVPDSDTTEASWRILHMVMVSLRQPLFRRHSQNVQNGRTSTTVSIQYKQVIENQQTYIHYRPCWSALDCWISESSN